MKIISRPDDQPAGEGAFTLKMDFEELQYIGAMLYNTRLGSSVYKEAAFKLVTTLDELFGDDFIQDASEAVDMNISIEDDRGNAIALHNNSNFCIEV
jgi:hypothetical protein